eukprot:gene19831-21773_t
MEQGIGEKIPLISQTTAANDEDEGHVTEIPNDEETKDEDDEKKDKTTENSLEDWQALMHMVKAFVGAGVLGLPSAVMHGGIMVGPVLLLVIGIICMHNIHTLVVANRAVCERLNLSVLSYGELVQELFSMYSQNLGRLFKIITDVLTCLLQLGFCCVYFVFLSVTMQKIAEVLDSRLWMFIILPPILAVASIRNISRLSYLTSLGNAILAFGFAVIYQYLLRHLKNPTHLPLSTPAQSLLLSFGQIVYAFEGIAVILPIEKRMKNKSSFTWVLRVTSAIIIVLYFTFAILGYIAFGADTQPSITLNLPKLPIYNALQSLFAIVIFVTYPLQFYVAVDTFKPILEERFDSKTIVAAEYALRVGLVLFTFFMAVIVPQLDNFMALIGSFSGAIIALVLPPILHTLCFWNEGLTKWQFYVNILVTLTGIFGTVCGTLSAIIAIIENYDKSTKAIASN